MKKIIIPIILMCSVISLKAQNDRDAVTFGLKAGVNIANVYDEQGQDFEADAKLGFAGGAFLGLPLGSVLGIQPEILFSQKGFRGSGSFLGSSYEFKRTTSYLDIPIQLQIKPTDVVTIVAGPQYSYLLKKEDEFDSGTFGGSQQEEFNNENFRKNIAGFVGGIDIYSGNLLFSARLGFDLVKNNGDGSSETPRYKNQWYQFTLGFKL